MSRLPQAEPDEGLLAELTTVQFRISAAEASYARRRELVTQIWEAGMMNQYELAAFLTKAAAEAGGTAVTTNAVSKMVGKARAARVAVG